MMAALSKIKRSRSRIPKQQTQIQSDANIHSFILYDHNNTGYTLHAYTTLLYLHAWFPALRIRENLRNENENGGLCTIERGKREEMEG